MNTWAQIAIVVAIVVNHWAAYKYGFWRGKAAAMREARERRGEMS